MTQIVLNSSFLVSQKDLNSLQFLIVISYLFFGSQAEAIPQQVILSLD
ncbi:hypothetical protein [Carboxylicivirga marina]|uniref:Uncharacterized protein n=1 Tax=Carboxylicivirga marina TaxID=2800988 RepID=A0ABS1HK88_9BACT|nr:hypothetical protein [Carboxylicivirga marina]MBK3517693.1 hypothetical protein [Carboxylicivirga marina]